MQVQTRTTVLLEKRERAFIHAAITTGSFYIEGLSNTQWKQEDTTFITNLGLAMNGNDPIDSITFRHYMDKVRLLGAKILGNGWPDDQDTCAMAVGAMLREVADFYQAALDKEVK